MVDPELRRMDGKDIGTGPLSLESVDGDWTEIELGIALS